MEGAAHAEGKMGPRVKPEGDRRGRWQAGRVTARDAEGGGRPLDLPGVARFSGRDLAHDLGQRAGPADAMAADGGELFAFGIVFEQLAQRCGDGIDIGFDHHAGGAEQGLFVAETRAAVARH
jgi:hypothetical protein